MEEHSQRKLAVILHADVVGSTQLVQKNESVAHHRMQDAFRRFSTTIAAYNGVTHELRGDALVAEFARASDAVSAALLFQNQNVEHNTTLEDDIRPRLRVGISLGEVVVADGTVTGEGVVLAQRLEQLADPDGVVVQGTVSETVPTRLAFEFESLGDQTLKGFEQPVRAFTARLAADAAVPEPEAIRAVSTASTGITMKGKRWFVAIAAVLVISIAGTLVWQSSRDMDVTDGPSGPRLAVMPFESLGDDTEQSFTNGFTDHLTTALSKFSDIVVYPTQTTKQLAEENAGCREIGDELKASFILHGTVNRTDSSLRVTTKLLDAKDCTQLWSESYDGDLTATDVFSVQDEITSRVASSIASSDASLWNWKKQQELQAKRPDSLESYECVLLANWWQQNFSEDIHRRAKDCLEQVVEIDPNYAPAHAELAMIYINSYKYDYKHKPPNALELAVPEINKAIELDPRNARAYWALAIHRFLTGSDFDEFETVAEQAIAVNANQSIMLADLGTYLALADRWERGKALLERAIELNPRHPRWFPWIICLNHFRLKEFKDARDCVLKMNLPNNHMVHTLLAAIYAELGEVDRAKQAIEDILAIHPPFAEDPRKPFETRRMSPEFVESIMDGLRKAGYEVPERTD